MAKVKELLEKATREEIDFFCNWRYPVCLAECLWHDADNMSVFSDTEFGNIRLYQYPTISWEWVQDLEHLSLNKQERMDAKKMCSDMYYLGARKIGKSKVALEMDMPMTFQYEKNGKSLFGSINENKLKNITDPVKRIIEKHPWFKMFDPIVEDKQQTFRLRSNNYRMLVINMNVNGKDTGSHWFGKHDPRIFIEEFSLETNDSLEKRKDATSEEGAVMRCVSKGTKVMLANEQEVNIEDLEIGDYVFAYDKNTKQIVPSEVKAVMCTGKKEVIEIFNRKGKLFLTPDHEIYADFGFGSEWIEAQDCAGKQTVMTNQLCSFTRKGVQGLKLKKINVKVDLDNRKTVDVYDIETEHGNFVANSFVIHNCSGMTNFTRHSPAGKAFYEPENQKYVVNLPQSVNPTWNEKKREQMKKDYQGETTIGFRVFVDGEVVEDGVSLLDMQRVRKCYKKIPYKLIELDKKRYEAFNGAIENLIHVTRADNVEEVYLAMDVGVTGTTEILVVGRIKDKFRLLYNIVISGLKIEEKLNCIKYIAEQMNANIIALDTNEGQGSGLADLLESVYGTTKVFRFKGTMNIETSIEKDENGGDLIRKGKPVYKEERMASFSVLRLQKFLYDEEFEVPVEDLKFDNQMSQVVAMVSKASGKVLYDCVAEENHYFDAWKILATVLHKIELIDSKPIGSKNIFLGFNF